MRKVIKGLQDIAGTKVTVVGAGRTGIAIARLCASYKAHVLLSEKEFIPFRKRPHLPRSIRVEYGGHSREIMGSHIIIKSPGIPYTAPVIKQAVRAGIPVVDEIEILFSSIDKKKVIGVTGTNGKTTTTMLIGSMLKAGGLATVVAGNIGDPLSAVMPAVRTAGAVVLELSSYQLEKVETFSPHIAVILNCTPDHLARHHSMASYRKAKQRIYRAQGVHDYCILNYEDKHCRVMARSCPAQVIYFSSERKIARGLYKDENGWHSTVKGFSFTIKPAWHLPGRHNIENGLAAMGCAALMNIKPSVIAKGMARFKGVEHRLEVVKRCRGVAYINDSKATNVRSTIAALESFSGPVWLIMGGQDKGSSYRPLIGLIKDRVVCIVLIGEAGPCIRRDLLGTVPMVSMGSMRRAVGYCKRNSRPGDVVLLSPACASFDQYTNFEERGIDFKKQVLLK